MEEELATLKTKLIDVENDLAKIVKRRTELLEELDRQGESADGKLKKDVRHIHHDVTRKEGDIFLLKKRIKQITYKLEIAAKLSKLELDDDITDLKKMLNDVSGRLKVNKQKAVETFDNIQKIQAEGAELAKGIEESRQKAMDECDIRTDKLMARLDVRQDFVDQKRAEISGIRRASGIPDPAELAEIRRLAALHDSARAANDDEDDD
ncbi:Hypothetical predicted protein [Mytilus galloprovincialis]|uniref:Uncharacterized protein n=1 Tax=Mytilus galloprovincialis TaxID=29158 RepID=A0A8B6C7T6_MYTGA|nr:Hypothetical predicted protein [Mytilus galloprovincialis]